MLRILELPRELEEDYDLLVYEHERMVEFLKHISGDVPNIIELIVYGDINTWEDLWDDICELGRE